MINRLAKISAYLWPYLTFLVFGLAFFFFQEHGDLVLWFEDHRNPVLNFFFKYWAYTGDWYFIVAVVLLVIYLRFRQGMILGLAMVCQFAISLFLKYLLFNDTPRPKTYFEGQRVLDLIEGVKIQDFNSFPSSQAMAIFALTLFIALFIGGENMLSYYSEEHF